MNGLLFFESFKIIFYVIMFILSTIKWGLLENELVSIKNVNLKEEWNGRVLINKWPVYEICILLYSILGKGNTQLSSYKMIKNGNNAK